MAKFEKGHIPWNKDIKGLLPWNTGKKLSIEHRQKLSEAHKGQKAWNKGLKGAQVAWNKGIPWSEEFKLKSSESRKGKPNVNAIGIKRTEKQRKRISDAHIGQVAWNKGTIGISNGRPKGMSHTEETKRKISQATKAHYKAGGKPWNYVTGKSKTDRRKYGTMVFNDWRMAVYERDRFICQMCSEKGKRLNCHHIKAFVSYPDLRFDIDNGVTLCEDCHMELHGLKKVKLKLVSPIKG